MSAISFKLDRWDEAHGILARVLDKEQEGYLSEKGRKEHPVATSRTT